jgi:peptidoglycan/LPS O-acetylase OafA/YrhL
VIPPWSQAHTQPIRMPAGAAPPSPAGRLGGFDFVRVLATCLVFYTHVSTWYQHRGQPLMITGVLDRFVVVPMRLNKDFGFLGFALFFVISGFLVAHVAAKERVWQFAIRRVLRVFPALMVAVLLAWVLVNLGQYAIPGGFTGVGIGDLLANLVLANYFRGPFIPLVGVTWTLIPQLAVWAMIGLMLPLFRREPWLAIGIQITVCSVVLSVMPNFHGVAVSSLANIGAFGTAVVIGEVIWLVWSRRAPLWAGVTLGVWCWVVFCWGDRLGYGRFDDSYPWTLAIAVLLVIGAVLASARMPRSRLVSYLSTRSYAVYLVHQTIAFTLLAKIWQHTWPSLALAVSVAAVLVASELLYRLVERPAAGLARRITHRPAMASAAR